MLQVLLVVVVLAVAFTVAGVPVALCLRRAGGGWASLVVDALVAGLVMVTLTVSLYAWFGVPALVLAGVLWLAVIVTAVVTRAGFPGVRRPARSDRWLIVAWVILVVGTIALRLRSVNFLPWVGDMGAYVNWANEFVRTGTLLATWPPYFSSYLAISSRLFGAALTTAGIPLAGLVLVLVVARISAAIGAGRWATFIAAAAAAVSVHAIWFSSFPASESLAAPLFLAWIGCVAGILLTTGRQRIAWVASAAVLMLSLGLLRAEAPLVLAPLLLLAVLSIVVAPWRSHAWAAWLAFAASLAGALGSYWYGIQRIAHYYVHSQVHGMLPASVYRAIDRAGLFQPTAVTAVILVLVSAVICAVGLLLARRWSRRTGPARAPRVLGLVLGSALFLGLLANVIVNGEVWHIVLRSGLWLTVVAIALFALIGWSRLPAGIVAYVLFLGTVAAFSIALQSYRLKVQRGHSFFMYWDRYLVSEYIPVMFVLFGLALTVFWARWGGQWVAGMRASARPVLRAAPPVIAVVLALAVVVPTLPQLVLVEKDTFMAGAYELDHDLAALIPAKSDAVVWSATKGFTPPEVVPGFVFPNTWMGFAKPMARTFGYNVVNISNRSDTRADVVLTATSLEKQAACSKTDSFVVFESELGGPSLPSRVTTAGITFAPLGTRTGVISLLSQPPKNGDWTHFRLTVRAWQVTIDPALVTGVSCTTAP